MVRLCRMRQAYGRPTTRIVSCKSNLQLAYDFRVRHKKCRRILKHVLKSRIKDQGSIGTFHDRRAFKHGVVQQHNPFRVTRLQGAQRNVLGKT